MEYSGIEVERKFHDCVVKAAFVETKLSPVEYKQYYTISVLTTDDGIVVNMRNRLGQLFSGKVSTAKFPTQSYPKIIFKYWLPENGVYESMVGPALITRKMGRFFKVGACNHTHLVLPIEGDLNPGIENVDFEKPIRESPTIWTKQLYLKGPELMFNDLRVGLVSKDVVQVDDPLFVSFLPSWVKNKWQIVL